MGTNSIIYNEDYICIGGDKLEILERNTQKCISKFSDIKNVLCMQMNQKYIIVKSTIGVYYIIDLTKKTLIKKVAFKGAKKTHQSKKFFLHNNFIIFDIMKLIDNKLYFVLYDLENKNHNKIELIEGGFYCQDYIIDFEKERLSKKVFEEVNKDFKKKIEKTNKLVSDVYLQPNSLNNQYTNCILIIVDIFKMLVVEKRNVVFQHGLFPVGLLDNDTILLKNMSLYSISTTQEFDFNLFNGFVNNENGYFVKLERISSAQIALIFSNNVLLYNIEKMILEKEIKGSNCSSFSIIDNNCYLGTWDGFFDETE